MANTFRKIGGAFFRETPQGLAAENNPRVLQDLYAGRIQAQPGDISMPGSSQVAEPSLVPASPGSPLLPGGGRTPVAPAANPMDNFAYLMMDALKQAKGVTTAELLKRRRELQRATIGRTGEITPEALRTFSPEQQAAIRSGDVKALQPDIDLNAYEIEKAQQTIDNFNQVFQAGMKISEEFAKNMVAPESVIQNAQKVVYANPDNLNEIMNALPNDKSRQKFIETLDYSKMTPKPKAVETEASKWLTVEEAAKLGVPYGTTRGSATGITPKKPLGDTQIGDLTQARLVKTAIARIGDLVEELGVQGPVIGRFRKLNPYDNKVVELNQLIAQTVPGLARGIFKEVGVLTDTDVNRYTQTMANEKLTKEQARTATENLLKKVNESINIQLDTLNRAGKDVREFEEIIGASGTTRTGKNDAYLKELGF